jgi:hypothetical protein
MRPGTSRPSPASIPRKWTSDHRVEHVVERDGATRRTHPLQALRPQQLAQRLEEGLVALPLIALKLGVGRLEGRFDGPVSRAASSSSSCARMIAAGVAVP